jgi:hypothetical protein
MTSPHRKTYIRIYRASNNTLLHQTILDKQLDPTVNLLQFTIPLSVNLTVGNRYRFEIVYESEDGAQSEPLSHYYVPTYGDELKPIFIVQSLGRDLDNPQLLKDTTFTRTVNKPIFYLSAIETMLPHTHDTYKSLQWGVYKGGELVTQGTGTLAYDTVDRVVKNYNQYSQVIRDTYGRLRPALELSQPLDAKTNYNLKCTVTANRLTTPMVAERTFTTGSLPAPTLDIQPYRNNLTIRASEFASLFSDAGEHAFVDKFVATKWKLIDTISNVVLIELTILGDGVVDHHLAVDPITKDYIRLRDDFALNTHLTVSCQYQGELFGWSDVVTNGFTVSEVNTITPTVTIEPNYYLTPTLVSTPLSSNPSSTIKEVIWTIFRQSDNAIIHTAKTLPSATDIYRYTVPSGVLNNTTTYQATVQHVTNEVGPSLTSSKLAFTTPAVQGLNTPVVSTEDTPVIGIQPIFTMSEMTTGVTGVVITGYVWTIEQLTPTNTTTTFKTTTNTLNLKINKTVNNQLHSLTQDSTIRVTGYYETNVIPQSPVSPIQNYTVGGINLPQFTITQNPSPLVVPFNINLPVIRRPNNDTTPVKLRIRLAGPRKSNATVGSWETYYDQEYNTVQQDVALGGALLDPNLDVALPDSFRLAARAHIQFISSSVGSTPNATELLTSNMNNNSYQQQFTLADMVGQTMITKGISPSGEIVDLTPTGTLSNGATIFKLPVGYGVQFTFSITGTTLPNQQNTMRDHWLYIAPVANNQTVQFDNVLYEEHIPDNNTVVGAYTKVFTIPASILDDINNPLIYSGVYLSSETAAGKGLGVALERDYGVGPTQAYNAPWANNNNPNLWVGYPGIHQPSLNRLLVPIIQTTSTDMYAGGTFRIGIIDLNQRNNEQLPTEMTITNFGMDFTTASVSYVHSLYDPHPDHMVNDTAIWLLVGNDLIDRHLAVDTVNNTAKLVDISNLRHETGARVLASGTIQGPSGVRRGIITGSIGSLDTYGGLHMCDVAGSTKINSYGNPVIEFPVSTTDKLTHIGKNVTPSGKFYTHSGCRAGTDRIVMFSNCTSDTPANTNKGLVARMHASGLVETSLDARHFHTIYNLNHTIPSGEWADIWAVGIRGSISSVVPSIPGFMIEKERYSSVTPGIKELYTTAVTNYGADFSKISDIYSNMYNPPVAVSTPTKMFWFGTKYIMVNGQTTLPYLMLDKLTSSAYFKQFTLPPTIMSNTYLSTAEGAALNINAQYISVNPSLNYIFLRIQERHPTANNYPWTTYNKTIILKNP